MDIAQAQDSSERDQLWANLRALRAEIDEIARGEFEPTQRQRQVIVLLARIVRAEMEFRAQAAAPD